VVAGASSIVVFSFISVFVVILIAVGRIVIGWVVEISSSASSVIFTVDCIIGNVLWEVEGLTIDVCSVVLVFADVCSVVVVVGSSVGRYPIVSSSSSVNFSSCVGW